MTTEVIAEALWGNFAQHRCVLSHTALPASARNDNMREANAEAYNRGMKDRERGKAFISCPFSFHSHPYLWSAWRRGWTRADILADDAAFMRVP